MVFRNFGGVSHKSDIYSYGMMVLKMVGVRTNPSGIQEGRSSQTYFPNWIYEHLEHGTDLPSTTIQIDAEEGGELKRKLIIVGLSCVQTNPSHRPSMSEVLEMIEGSFHSLRIPPRESLLYSLSDVPQISSTKSQEEPQESSIYTHQPSN